MLSTWHLAHSASAFVTNQLIWISLNQGANSTRCNSQCVFSPLPTSVQRHRSHWSVSQTSLFWLFWKSSRATFSFIQILLPFMELVSAAFAPYRVRPFEFAPTLYCVRPHTFRVRPHQVVFAPTLYRVRPHTFRVRPHQVEFAPWLSDIQMSWFVTKALAEFAKCHVSDDHFGGEQYE